MADDLASRLRRRHLVAQTVRIKFRYPDMTTHTRQSTLAQPTDRADTVYVHGESLLWAHWDRVRPLRLLGLAVSGLLEDGGYQLDLFEHGDLRRIQLDEALDAIRARYGRDAIRPASLMRRPEGSDED
jgi:DNA polymerase-4